MKSLIEIHQLEPNPLACVPRKTLIAWVGMVFVLLTLLKWMFSLWTDSYAGIFSLVTAFIVTSLGLRRWGVTWSNLGLKKPKSYRKTFYVFILLTIVTLATALLSVYIAKSFFVKPAETARFVELKGNLAITLWWIILGWSVGAFIEELMYRAFFISALQQILGNQWFATTVAILIPGLIWAARHIYFKGVYGAVFMFFSSIVFGLFYVLSKRNLWPNILLHGFINTFGFIHRY